MPSQIRLYSLVRAHVGPFLNDDGPRDTATHTGPDGVVRPRLQRRKRQRHTGIVIVSAQERLWQVKWDQRREESEHTANELRLEGEASEAQKTAARVARLEQHVATEARVEQQPAPTAGEQPMAATTTEATSNNEATTTNEAATTMTNEEAPTANEEAEPMAATTEEAATTGAEHVPPPGEDGEEADPDRVEMYDHFNPAKDFDLFDGEDTADEHEGGIHQQKWIWHQQNKQTLMDAEVGVGQGQKQIVWRVNEDTGPSEEASKVMEFEKVGVCDFDFNPPDADANDARGSSRGSSRARGSSNSRPAKRVDFLSLFVHLWPGDWREQLKTGINLLKTTMPSLATNVGGLKMGVNRGRK
jgi:hypothetical protein